MFGLFCKGLHCAGCGKGIPLTVVIALSAFLVARGAAIGNALSAFLSEIAVLAVILTVATVVALGVCSVMVAKLMRYNVMDMSRFDYPSFTAQKEWYELANVDGRNAFLAAHSEGVNVGEVMNRAEYLALPTSEMEVVYRED